MVVISKLFNEGIRHRQCCGDLVHTHSCTMNSLFQIQKFIGSNSKYFGPIVLLSTLVKIRKMNKEILKDSLKYFLEIVLAGSSIAWFISIFICSFRHIFGEFKYYSFAYLPSFLGIVLSLFITSPRVARLYQTSVFQCTIESFLIRRQNFITKAIGNSKFLQTFIFMCCGTIIMYAKQNNIFRGFWFLKPNPKFSMSTKEEELKDMNEDERLSSNQQHLTICSHEKESCNHYFIHGVRNYLAVGFGLDTFKMLMSQTPKTTHGLMAKVLMKFGNFKIRSAAFLASYIGIYRFVHCYLNRRTGTNTELNHIIAAFLSGSCYMFYPKLTLLTYGIVASIEILWSMFKSRKSSAEDNKILKFIKALPYATILYPFALAYLVHTFTLRKHYISSMGDVIINGVTNNYARDINFRVQEIERQMEADAKASLGA